MLICLAATSTPFVGTVPRISKPTPAMTRKPQKTSALQRRDIHTVIARGNSSAGRNAIASVAETSANHRKKIAERRNITEPRTTLPLREGRQFAKQISGRGTAQAAHPSPKNAAHFSTLPQGEGRLARCGARLAVAVLAVKGRAPDGVAQGAG